MSYLINYFFYLLPVLSGVLLALPFAYSSLYLFSWIGLIPFLFFLEKEKRKADFNLLSIFLAGTIMGIIIIFISSSWLYYPLVDFSGMPWIIGFILLILVFVLFGLIYGFWACLFVFVKKSKGISPFWLAISWTAIEFIRFKLISVYPLGFLAYTQSNFLSFLQLAEYGGIYLVGFILLLINAYLYKALIKRKIRFLLPVFLIVITIFTIGLIKNNYFEENTNQTLTVGIVQTNIDPVDKWKVANIESIMDYLIEQSREIPDAQLIVWPESALTFDIIRNEFYRKDFLLKIADIESYLQASSISIIDGGLEKYNSSFLIEPPATLKDRYNKIRLLPFGEYMPLNGLVEILTGKSWSSQFPGNEITIFSIDEKKYKLAICSEILYPDLVKKGVEEAEFIVNQSNEAWYKRGNLQEQMWAAARFRAVENRRSILKAGNKAYGGVISMSGKEIIKKHSSELSSFSVELPLSNGETLYQKWGDYVGYTAGIIALLLTLIKLILIWRGKKK